MSSLNVSVNLLNILHSIKLINDTCNDVYKTYSDKEQSSGEKTMRISMDVLCAVAQLYALSQDKEDVSLRDKFQLRTLALTTELAKDYVQGNTSDAFSMLAYQTGEIGSVLTKRDGYSNLGFETLKSGVIIYESSSGICNGSSYLWNKFNAVIGNFWSNSEQTETLATNEYSRLQFAQALRRAQRLVELSCWEDFEEIPPEFKAYYPPDYRCALTGKCIRSIVVLSDQENYSLYFERNAVKGWIKEKTKKTPKGWPESLPLPIMMSDFKPAKSEQNLIDRALEKAGLLALDELKNLVKKHPELKEDFKDFLE